VKFCLFDISKCINDKCKKACKCLRFLCEDSEYQSYLNGKDCCENNEYEQFIEIKRLGNN